MLLGQCPNMSKFASNRFVTKFWHWLLSFDLTFTVSCPCNLLLQYVYYNNKNLDRIKYLSGRSAFTAYSCVKLSYTAPQSALSYAFVSTVVITSSSTKFGRKPDILSSFVFGEESDRSVLWRRARPPLGINKSDFDSSTHQFSSNWSVSVFIIGTSEVKSQCYMRILWKSLKDKK